MQQEIAKVSYLEGSYAFLNINNNAACGECSSKSSCGSAKLFNPLASVKDNGTIKVENTLNVREGDSVLLALSPAKLIQGTLLVYTLPLLALFVFAAIGQVLGGEMMSILGGLTGLLFTLLLVNKLMSNESVAQQFVPTMLKLSPETDETDKVLVNMHNKSTPPPVLPVLPLAKQ